MDVGRQPAGLLECADADEGDPRPAARIMAPQGDLAIGTALVPLTGTGSIRPDSSSTSLVSTTALTANAPPLSRWHSLQWQAWTIIGARFIR